MEYVNQWVPVEPQDFNCADRYLYLSQTTQALRQFGEAEGICPPWLLVEDGVAAWRSRETLQGIAKKYVSPFGPCNWGFGDVKDALWVRRAAGEGEAACGLPDKAPNTENYSDFINRLFPEFAGKTIKDVTLQVTEDCNLRCSYCYQTNKTHARMSKETALAFIDQLLEDKIPYCNRENASGLTLEFLGGEPFLEMELIDTVTRHVLRRVIELKHPWRNFIRFSFTSNGTLYRTEAVQRYLREFRPLISLSISVDGDKALHDRCRVFPDGSGSYELAIDAAKDWAKLSGQTLSTKMTLAPANIANTSKAIINLVENGYRLIHVNCVYEEGWTLGHAQILYREMKRLSDWMFENEAWDKAYIRLFAQDEFVPLEAGGEDDKNWCGGTGDMLALDYTGAVYPCVRYMPSSLGDAVEPLQIGRVGENGFTRTPQEAKCVDCLKCITRKTQSTTECYECPIAKGCGWCSAYNYQVFGTPDKRATYICWMHKARALASIEHWDRYTRVTGVDKRIPDNMRFEWIAALKGRAALDGEESDEHGV